MLVVHVIRKPLSEGSVASNVLKWGAGAIHINASRIEGVQGGSEGRWPANLLLQHLPGCVCEGTTRVAAQRGGGGVKHPGNKGTAQGVYGGYVGKEYPDVITKGDADVITKGDADGMETVQKWACVEGCPVADLDGQSGAVTGSFRASLNPGGASRYFKQIQGEGGE